MSTLPTLRGCHDGHDATDRTRAAAAHKDTPVKKKSKYAELKASVRLHDEENPHEGIRAWNDFTAQVEKLARDPRFAHLGVKIEYWESLLPEWPLIYPYEDDEEGETP
ncbi:hypothetical protein [Nocardiopsis synnemataformans]|uniref:hypothetical protein n=1 Tax=Nocardiopsis synnemataformans TaxID=61305 RepID=UPI003EB9B9C7